MPARDSNYHKNILVEEREFMRMERELKKIGPQADGVGEQQLFTHCQYKEEFIKLKQVFDY